MKETKNTYAASVIVSVYSNVSALRAVLDSLSVQTFSDFEIIISEDAEHAEMADFIASYPFRNAYQHLTQHDEGWRKNKALNRAIMAANSDWLIFVDGDCVLHPRFVEQHVRLSGEQCVVAGKRVKLNDTLSHQLLNDNALLPRLSRMCLQMALGIRRKNGCRFVEEGIYISPRSLFGFVPCLRKMHQLKGCNMSFSRKAILAINGFDEDYVRPAIGEDIDLVWRFERAGFHLVSARNLAVVYHLNHKENWTSQDENIALMQERQKEDAWRCKNGIEKL